MALVPITHGVEESVKEIYALADKPGIKGIMIPTMWHDAESYGHEKYDPIWQACHETGLVVHTHSGEADAEAYNENMAQYMLEVAFWTHRPLWQFLLSGKFDKYPNFKYVPVECGSWWLGDLLWKTDVMFGGTNWKVKKMSSRTKGLLERLPSEYVGENVFIGASTMSKVELRRRYVNGVDALMWGTDYPHPEGSCPTPSPASRPTSSRSRSRRPASARPQRGQVLRPRRGGPSGDRRRGRSHARATQPGSGAAHRPQRHPRGPLVVRGLRGPLAGVSRRPTAGSTTSPSSGRTCWARWPRSPERVRETPMPRSRDRRRHRRALRCPLPA